MEPVNFAYWMQSLFEVEDKKSFTTEQTKIIKQHALLVLKTLDINDKKYKPVQMKPGMLQWQPPKRYQC
jgi:hypothetical protein